jgi:glycosyltransferase involved in cell wall biosynthesis
VREKRAKRESGQTIGYFARLAPEKGFDVMVDAFIELAPRFPEATLRVAGWLSEKDNDFYAEQLAKIESVGLNDRFTHVEAPDGEAKLDFLSELDAFSVPARFVEPKGLYALEAIACGIPFVAPDRGIFPELVGQCGAGVLCEPENPKSLADSLGKLLEDREGVGRMAENGFEWLQENGSREAMAKATAEVFERVLAND